MHEICKAELEFAKKGRPRERNLRKDRQVAQRRDEDAVRTRVAPVLRNGDQEDEDREENANIACDRQRTGGTRVRCVIVVEPSVAFCTRFARVADVALRLGHRAAGAARGRHALQGQREPTFPAPCTRRAYLASRHTCARRMSTQWADRARSRPAR